MMKNGQYFLVVAPPDYPGKKYRGKYIYYHHYVWWLHTGQVVPKGYVIHHKDEDKSHNAIGNLELKTQRDHVGEHSHERRKTFMVRCGGCGKIYPLPGGVYRNRITQSQTGKLYCSLSCRRR